VRWPADLLIHGVAAPRLPFRNTTLGTAGEEQKQAEGGRGALATAGDSGVAAFCMLLPSARRRKAGRAGGRRHARGKHGAASANAFSQHLPSSTSSTSQPPPVLNAARGKGWKAAASKRGALSSLDIA